MAKDSDPRFPILRELLGIPRGLRVSGLRRLGRFRRGNEWQSASLESGLALG
jgi:hypothetical protein